MTEALEGGGQVSSGRSREPWAGASIVAMGPTDHDGMMPYFKNEVVFVFPVPVPLPCGAGSQTGEPPAQRLGWCLLCCWLCGGQGTTGCH